VLLVTSGLLLVIALALAIFGATNHRLIPVCFNPDDLVVCPTATTGEGVGRDIDLPLSQTVSRWDIALVEIVGLLAAAVASAAALRGIRGSSLPYGLPVALAVLKLPTGALTAVLGLLLMAGGFVPGLSALDSSAQILSWAIVFGYSQELFTRFVDKQAQSVLDDVGGRGAAGDRPKKR
jgi:hypothetical protein